MASGHPTSSFRSNMRATQPSRALSNNDWRARGSPSPAPPSTPRQRQMLRPEEVKHGLFALLALEDVEQTSMVYSNNWCINAGASGHPVCIVGSLDDGKISCCLQTTSFNETSIQTKYPIVDNPIRQHYLSVDQDQTTVPHNGLPLLRLAGTAQMLKQSYVHLDHFFMIETSNLRHWYDNTYHLTPSSVADLQTQFRAMLAGRIPRPAFQTIPSPLSKRDWMPAELGVPSTPATTLALPWESVGTVFRAVNKSTTTSLVNRGPVSRVSKTPVWSSPQKKRDLQGSWRRVSGGIRKVTPIGAH